MRFEGIRVWSLALLIFPASAFATDHGALPPRGAQERQSTVFGDSRQPAYSRSFQQAQAPSPSGGRPSLARPSAPEPEPAWSISAPQRRESHDGFRGTDAARGPIRVDRRFPQAPKNSAVSRPQGRVINTYGANGAGPEAAGRVRRIWSETDTARVKTIYDESGNIVYRKAWDKATGEELAAPSRIAGAVGAPDPYGLHEAPPEDLRAMSGAKKGKAFVQTRAAPAAEPPPSKHHLRERIEVVRDGPTGFSLSLPVWHNELRGTLQGAAGGTTGTIAADRDTMPGAELSWPYWQLSYFPFRHLTTTSGTFTYKGSTFTGGAQLRLDADVFELTHRRHLWEKHVLSFDWMIGAKGIFPDFVVTQGATQSTFDEPVPIPYLGLHAMLEIDRNLVAKGFIKYSSLSVGDVEEEMLEYEVGLGYRWGSDHEFSRSNNLSIGWRVLTLDFVENPTTAARSQADIEFRGPQARLTAYF